MVNASTALEIPAFDSHSNRWLFRTIPVEVDIEIEFIITGQSRLQQKLNVTVRAGWNGDGKTYRPDAAPARAKILHPEHADGAGRPV
jgi:hypothetical protein